ncbi:MAG: amidophosphoribosyltransferase [Proteobacteria bacterium]|nr:amidophosphoribosyltransferase [Pseudomonadota bacterium]
MEGFRDETGLCGIAGHRHAAQQLYLGLHALQHRGREGAAIVASDGNLLRRRRGTGLVQEVFTGPILQELQGNLAIGQVHGAGYGQRPTQVQDRLVFARYALGQIAIAVGGRFSNGVRLKKELQERGAVFHTAAEAEILMHLMARSPQRTMVNRLVDALWKVEGAFSVLVSTEDRLVGVRDPRGFRPLIQGRLNNATVLASEDTAIRMMGGTVIREVPPGEMVIVDSSAARRVSPFPKQRRTACVHEFVGLASADAEVFGLSTYSMRVALGERLAREQPCPGDVVVAIPTAGVPQALGYAKVVQKPFREGLIRAPYTGRQYLEPAGGVERFGTRVLHTAVPAVAFEKRVVVVASSLVTGRGISKAVQLVREAGAVEVHLRIAAPPVLNSCPYGVGCPTPEELIYPTNTSLAEMARKVGSDTIGFLSLDGLHAIVGRRVDGTTTHCDACFSGNYPLPPEEPVDQLPLFEA